MGGEIWLAIGAVLALAMSLARLKAQGAKGTVRTKIVAEVVETGETYEVPFFTFRL